MFNFDDASKASRETIDGMLKSYSELTRGYQAIADEAGNYSRRCFEEMTAFTDALAATRSVEAAYALQASYIRAACDSFIAEAGKMSDMYADLAKSAYKRHEVMEAASTAVKTADAA